MPSYDVKCEKIVWRKARIRPDHNKPKRPRGKPMYEPSETTRNQVKTMVIAGIDQRLMAKVLAISPPTLRKHYREEIDTASVMANAQVARNLYTKAIGNGPTAVTAAIYWTKVRMGWKEPVQDVNVAGELKVVLGPGDRDL